MQLEKAVLIAGHSLVALQNTSRVASFEQQAGIWWYQTQANLNAMLTNTDFTPLEVSAAARALGLKKSLLIHQFLSPDADQFELISRFAKSGFNLSNRHYLMSRAITAQPELPQQTWQVFRAETSADETRISKAAKETLLSSAQLPPSTLGVRLYAAQDSSQIIAWARIAQLQTHTAWLDDLFTKAAWRKRGVMASILQRIDQDALLFGARNMLLFSAQHNLEYHLGHGYSIVAVKLRFAVPNWFDRIKSKFKQF